MSELTQQRLKELLHYDQASGLFAWKLRTSNVVRVGDVAGTKTNGYTQIKLDGVIYKAHRLVWLYVYGCWPSHQVDHINGIRDDNRLANLREADNKQNQENTGLKSNNSTGFRGVVWYKRHQKFMARVHHHGKQIHLGYFDTAKEAAAAAAAERAELFTHDTGRDRIAA